MARRIAHPPADRVLELPTLICTCPAQARPHWADYKT
jgi:hypothetical protein